MYRLEQLFSTFEYVTTNISGSHIAYATMWGAKVSIFGDYAEAQVEDYANAPFYVAYPHLLQPAIEAVSDKVTRQHFPEFFVDHPKHAVERVEWGEYQVGADNRLSPRELRKAFGWGLAGRTKQKAFHFAVPIARKLLPADVKDSLYGWLHPEFGRKLAIEREAKRINEVPAYQQGTTSVLGAELTFIHGASCAYQLRSLFGNEVYKFSTTKECPTIIDGGANIGMASIYFARLFPKARVLAFEADPAICKVLQKNLQSFKACNVEVHEAALWIDDQGVAFEADGGDAGRVVAGDHVQAVRVPSKRLRDLLDEPIDLLKLDVEGAELDMLLDCADALENVERIFVEYHSSFDKPQRMHELITLLNSAGFRLHIHSPSPAMQPLTYRPVPHGYDLLLEIFAFRKEFPTLIRSLAR